MNVVLKAFLKERNYVGVLKYKNVKYTDKYFITNEVGYTCEDEFIQFRSEFFMNKENGKYTFLDKYNNYLCGGYSSEKGVKGITFGVSEERDMTYYNNKFEIEEEEEYFLIKQKNEHYDDEYYVSFRILEYNFGKYDIVLCLSPKKDKAIRFKRL